MQTTRGISASMASWIEFAANGGLASVKTFFVKCCDDVWEAYGTKIADASAPTCSTASRTVAKTGLPRCSVPAFLGFVPPTTFVPRVCQFD